MTAKALLEKTERIRVKAAAQDKVELDRLAAEVRRSLDEEEWESLDAACGQLSDVLFYLEDA